MRQSIGLVRHKFGPGACTASTLARPRFHAAPVLLKPSHNLSSINPKLGPSTYGSRTFSGSVLLRSGDKKGVNFWLLEPGTEDEWWPTYESTRPSYEASAFLQSIYDYHAERAGNVFELAHDVAAGAGRAAKELARQFRHVVASDDSEASLGVARRRLGEQAPGKSGRITFLESSAEKIGEHQRPASVDLVTVAESIPMMDMDLALGQFASVLKPGATLAVWFYGRPLFNEPEYVRTCQPIWDDICARTFSKAIYGGPPGKVASWSKASGTIAAWMDDIDMSRSKLWEDVRRVRYNQDLAGDLGFYSSEKVGLDPRKPQSAVDAGSEVTSRVDDLTFWQETWDVEGVKKYCAYACPNIKQQVEEDKEISRLLEQLTRAMGGKSARRSYTIACSLILARRAA